MLVVPIIEYASTVWSPFYEVHIESLEKVQRRFTRFVFIKFHYPYVDYHSRLTQLNMLSLRKRRLVHDQMLLYSIVRDQVSIQSSIINVSYRANFSRRSKDVFYEKTWTLNTANFAPLPRLIRGYNRHLTEVDIFHLSRSTYKESILEILLEFPG
jgi:hypothetical protein